METVEVEHDTSGAVKAVEVTRDCEGLRVLWPNSGCTYRVDRSGRVLYEVEPLNGMFRVDCQTGQLIGSQWFIPEEQLETVLGMSAGSHVYIQHRLTDDKQRVQIVDVEQARAIVRIYADGKTGMKRCLPTGWRVKSNCLQRLAQTSAA